MMVIIAAGAKVETKLVKKPNQLHAEQRSVGTIADLGSLQA
jgi:hypothetical protein